MILHCNTYQSLAKLQAFVDGPIACVACVASVACVACSTMWVNEEGDLRSLPLNAEASVLYGEHIYGNAVVVHDEHGIEANAPKEVFEKYQLYQRDSTLPHPITVVTQEQLIFIMAHYAEIEKFYAGA